jgi:DNA-binding MarR family transcriptional regulator
MNAFAQAQLDVLHALYQLAQGDTPADAVILARAVGSSVGDVVRVLDQLELRGLADSLRVRLTFEGLALAVATGAARARRRSARRRAPWARAA